MTTEQIYFFVIVLLAGIIFGLVSGIRLAGRFYGHHYHYREQ